ncbi:hypothetical protein ACVWDG_24895, partial [Escherichia coli]
DYNPAPDLACALATPKKVHLPFLTANELPHFLNDLAGYTGSIITKGTIQRKQRSKSISDFKDQSMVKFMRGVMDDLSVIQAIVNKSKVNQGDMVYISHEDMINIDKLKAKIASDSSEIARLNNIDITLNVVDL